jgi:hypothetical protein
MEGEDGGDIPATPAAYDSIDGSRRAAHFVDRILKGCRPSRDAVRAAQPLVSKCKSQGCSGGSYRRLEAMSARADEVIE